MKLIIILLLSLICIQAIPHNLDKEKVYKALLQSMYKDILSKKPDFGLDNGDDDDDDDDEITLTSDYDDDDDEDNDDDEDVTKPNNDPLIKQPTIEETVTVGSDSADQEEDPVKRDETPRLFEPKDLDLEKKIKEAFGDKDQKSLFDEHEDAYGFAEVDGVKEFNDELDEMRKGLFQDEDEDEEDEEDEKILMGNNSDDTDDDEEFDKMVNSQLTEEDKKAMEDTSDVESILKDGDADDEDYDDDEFNNDNYQNDAPEDEDDDEDDDDDDDDDFFPFDDEEEYKDFLRSYRE